MISLHPLEKNIKKSSKFLHPLSRFNSSHAKPISWPNNVPTLQAKCACGGGCPQCFGPSLQAKLRIGPQNDKYEQEADRVADQVMRMPDPALQLKPG